MESPAGSPSPREYVFGPFRLDPVLHQLFRDDQSILLSPKVFDLLLVLVANRHRVVEKAELLKRVWPDSFASDDSLIQAVSAVRRALGDDSTHAEYIATIPKRGYRFIAPVLDRSEGGSPEPLEAAPHHPLVQQGGSREMAPRATGSASRAADRGRSRTAAACSDREPTVTGSSAGRPPGPPARIAKYDSTPIITTARSRNDMGGPEASPRAARALARSVAGTA